MPRLSAAAQSVAAIEPGQRRPEPPRNLSDEAKFQWRAVVSSMPPDWFPRETHGMLTQYCRLVVRCQAVAEALDQARASGEDMAVRDYQNLMRVEMQLSNTIAQLATKMRISQQSSSTYDKKRKRHGKKSVPWESGEGAEAEADAG